LSSGSGYAFFCLSSFWLLFSLIAYLPGLNSSVEDYNGCSQKANSHKPNTARRKTQPPSVLRVR
jgi:hypothetical protein